MSSDVVRMFPAKFTAGSRQMATALAFVGPDQIIAVRRRSNTKYQVLQIQVEPESVKWQPKRDRVRAKAVGQNLQVNVKKKSSCNCSPTAKSALKDIETVEQLVEFLEGVTVV